MGDYYLQTWYIRVAERLQGALSGLRQFLANESPLKMMKNAFYFILKAPFTLKTLTTPHRPPGHTQKQLI